jgi:hypothetical protein
MEVCTSNPSPVSIEVSLLVSAENLLSLKKNSYDACVTLSYYATDKSGPPAWGLGEGVILEFTSPCDNNMLQSVGKPLKTGLFYVVLTSFSVKYRRIS